MSQVAIDFVSSYKRRYDYAIALLEGKETTEDLDLSVSYAFHALRNWTAKPSSLTESILESNLRTLEVDVGSYVFGVGDKVGEYRVSLIAFIDKMRGMGEGDLVSAKCSEIYSLISLFAIDPSKENRLTIEGRLTALQK